mgnify:CR=1 FL=1
MTGALSCSHCENYRSTLELKSVCIAIPIYPTCLFRKAYKHTNQIVLFADVCTPD